MESSKTINGTDIKILLSTLWIFVLLNIIFAIFEVTALIAIIWYAWKWKNN